MFVLFVAAFVVYSRFVQEWFQNRLVMDGGEEEEVLRVLRHHPQFPCVSAVMEGQPNLQSRNVNN